MILRGDTNAAQSFASTALRRSVRPGAASTLASMGDADFGDDRRDGERLLRSHHHRALASIVTEGMPARHGRSFMDQRDGMETGPHAVAVLFFATSTADCDGFPALYYDLGDLTEELVWAAEHVGAGAYADLFRRAEQAIPEDARSDPTKREAFVLDHQNLFEAFDEAYYALENAGDVLLEHAIRYLLAHPEEFTPYRS